MKLEIIGKFYDNQSLSIINRNLLLEMDKKGTDVLYVKPPRGPSEWENTPVEKPRNFA